MCFSLTCFARLSLFADTYAQDSYLHFKLRVCSCLMACLLRLRRYENDSLQTPQGNFVSVCFAMTWFFRVSGLRYFFSQPSYSHLKNTVLSWAVFLCLSNPVFDANFLSQMAQGNLVPRCIANLCFRREPTQRYFLLHPSYSHLKAAILRWTVLSWTFNSLLDGNFISHFGHACLWLSAVLCTESMCFFRWCGRERVW